MRIAVVADIHGNVRALRAVMDDIKQVAPDTVVNLGDCVSGPLEAAETADVLMSLAWTTIRGNHDRWLLEKPREEMGRSDAAAFAELKNHHHAWLSTLEETATIENIFLCHGTPGSDTTYLLETVQQDGDVRLATQAEVGRRLGSEHAPIILCGHTHVPRIVRLDRRAHRDQPRAASACRPSATPSRSITRWRSAHHTPATRCWSAPRPQTRGGCHSGSLPTIGMVPRRAPRKRAAKTGRNGCARGMRASARPSPPGSAPSRHNRAASHAGAA